MAVVHVLERIQRDPRLAYHFDPLTESYALLTQARAEMLGHDVEGFRKAYAATLRFEAPKCRTCREAA
jgi:hypothetical protein